MKPFHVAKFSGISQVILAFVLFSSLTLRAQTFTESNFPIVIITTDLNPSTGQSLEILDDPKILASMKIIKRPDGTKNYITDQNTTGYLNYNGRIGIEIRGSSSQALPKKGYGLTTLKADNISNNNVSILNMPAENDWILNGIAFDPSLIRDYLSYNLSRQMGNYATRTVYCELVINGDYKGLYLLQEKIKSNVNRVNVLKIKSTDISMPNISGGYITKADKTTGGDPVAWTMSSYAGSTDFIHELPKPASVTPEQNSYIYNEFSKLETTSSANNTSLINGYPSVIDVPSFIDFMLINELSSNSDGYQFSTFFHKDRGGKLRAGPIWDFNLTYGNDLFFWGLDRSHYDLWQFSNGDNEGAKFWRDLFNDPNYKCYLAKRWAELTQAGQPLNYNSLVQYIDATVTAMSDAKDREQQRWGTIPDQATEISNLKTFLFNRIKWINDHINIGASTDCFSVQTPPLVITKINYNPGLSSGFSVSDDLEFVEIKNTGTTVVDLTGVYFKELGLSYQFPANSSIAANTSIYLASNATTFQNKYGITAFGQFIRNLSNTTQRIVLADGYGNTIDSVEYLNVAPWPSADGNGSYLQLIDAALDNSLAENWIASTNISLSKPTFIDAASISIYPNPVSNILRIHTQKPINGIKIYDVLGNLIQEVKQKTDTISTDWTSYAKGVYLLIIYDDNGFTTRKIVKQ